MEVRISRSTDFTHELNQCKINNLRVGISDVYTWNEVKMVQKRSEECSFKQFVVVVEVVQLFD